MNKTYISHCRLCLVHHDSRPHPNRSFDLNHWPPENAEISPDCQDTFLAVSVRVEAVTLVTLLDSYYDSQYYLSSVPHYCVLKLILKCNLYWHCNHLQITCRTTRVRPDYLNTRATHSLYITYQTTKPVVKQNWHSVSGIALSPRYTPTYVKQMGSFCWSTCHWKVYVHLICLQAALLEGIYLKPFIYTHKYSIHLISFNDSQWWTKHIINQ